MKHAYVDKYSNIDSPIHRLDARIKTVAIFLFILLVIATPPEAFWAFWGYGAFVAGLIVLSRIPVFFILKRSLVIIPFVVMVTIFIPFFKGWEAGWILFWNVLIKSWLSILAMILLSASTKFPTLLKTLAGLRVPKIFIMILSFMYRYIFLIQDELMRMWRAKESRNTGASKWSNIKALANMIGVLFIRSYERGEDVYLAMCSRGFDGTIRTIDDEGN